MVRRALAVEVSDRPADAGVVAKELTTYLEGVETRLRQAELAEVQAETRAIEERRRRRQTVVLGDRAVLAVLVIGVIGTSWGLIRAGRALKDEAKQRQLAENSERTAVHVATLKPNASAKETVPGASCMSPTWSWPARSGRAEMGLRNTSTICCRGTSRT